MKVRRKKKASKTPKPFGAKSRTLPLFSEQWLRPQSHTPWAPREETTP